MSTDRCFAHGFLYAASKLVEWEVCFFGGRGGSAPKASRGFAATLTCSFGCGSMYSWNSFHPKLVGLNNANLIGWSHQELIREKDMKEELWPRRSWWKCRRLKGCYFLTILNLTTWGQIPGFVWTHVMAVRIPHCFIPLPHQIHGIQIDGRVVTRSIFWRPHIVTGRDCVRQFPIILQKCKIAIESHVFIDLFPLPENQHFHSHLPLCMILYVIPFSP